MTRVSNFRNQSLPQLTLAIRGGHCGLSPGFLEEPISHSALVPLSTALNVTKLSSTFTVIDRVVDVMAHLR